MLGIRLTSVVLHECLGNLTPLSATLVYSSPHFHFHKLLLFDTTLRFIDPAKPPRGVLMVLTLLLLSLQPPSTPDAVPERRGEQPAGGLPQTDAACGVARGWQPASPSPVCCPANQVCSPSYVLPCAFIFSFFCISLLVSFCFLSPGVSFCCV